MAQGEDTLLKKGDDAARDALVGTLVGGRYRILDSLGRGGMSTVYKAVQEPVGRLVALKVLYSHLLSDESLLKRFQQEAKATSALSHKNVVSLIDYGTEKGQPFLVMDFLDGNSLDDILRDEPRMPFLRAVHIFSQAALGLAAAHLAGIIHRDIKPGNLVVINSPLEKDLVKIVDFGIAKMLDSDTQVMQRLTQTGEVFGSPLYMSPEQCNGQELDSRSDIYSLGCVMYEALTGEPPIIAGSALDTMRLKMTQIPDSFATKAPDADIPPRLEEIVFRALATDPGKRYQTALELKNDLERFASEHTGSHQLSLGDRLLRTERTFLRFFKKSGTVLVAAVVVLLLGFSLAGFMLPRFMEYRWRTMLNNGVLHLKAGKYAEAEQELNSARKLAAGFKDHGAALSTTYGAQATLFEKIGRSEDLEEVRRRRRELVSSQLVKEYGFSSADLDRLAAAALNAVPVNYVNSPFHDTLQFETQAHKLETAASICDENGKDERAKDLLKRALLLRKKLEKEDQSGVIRAYGALASICEQTDASLNEARTYAEKQLKVARRNPGKNKQDLILALTNLGRLYAKQGHTGRAEKLLAEALKYASTQEGKDDEVILACLEEYAQLLLKAGKKEKAADLAHQANILRRMNADRGKRI